MAALVVASGFGGMPVAGAAGTGAAGTGAVSPAAVPGGAWIAPRAGGFVSGPSRPLVAAWGIAYNPVTDEMVVGDYVTNQIRRFDRDGHYLGDFANPTGNTESIISAVAVDPRDGATYAAATSLTSKVQVRKYDKAGNYLWGFNLPGRVAWLAVDADGHLWYPPAYGSYQLYQFEIDDAARTVRQLSVSGVKGTATCQATFLNGVAVGADGRVYAADGVNRTVHVYDHAGTCLYDVGDAKIYAGDLRGVAVDDARDRLYVADAKGPDVEVFTRAGAHLETWHGGGGTAPGDFGGGPRQLTVTPDGHVHVADYSGFRVQEFDTAGHVVDIYPKPAREADQAGIIEPWGLTSDPANGDLLVADEWGQHITRFTADGTLLRSFGRRGRTPDAYVNYPRSVAVDPDTSNVWVSSAEGEPWLVAYDKDFHVLHQIVTKDLTTGLKFFNGEAYLVYRAQGIEVYDPTTGALKRRYPMVGNGSYQGIGIDPDSGRMWVSVRDKAQVRVLNTDGSLRWTLDAVKSTADIAFRNGVAYVSDTGANVILAYDAETGEKVGSFGGDGVRPGQLRGPRGLTFGPDGRLYVVELRNQRIQAFTWAPAAAAETVKPTLVWSSPAGNAGPALPVRISGTVTDDTAVSTVEVSVKDLDTNRWVNTLSGTWSATAVYNQTVLSGPAQARSWEWTGVPLEYGDRLEVRVRARDMSGNTTSLVRQLTVADATPPTVAVDSPSGSVEPGLTPVRVSAVEDGALDTVTVSVVDRATGRWWSPSGFTDTETWLPTYLEGAARIVDVVLPPQRTLDLVARARNTAGAATTSNVVTVTTAADTTRPETSVTAPAPGATVSGPLTLAGKATDNLGVASVALTLREVGGAARYLDTTTGALGTTPVWNAAALAEPGAVAAAWSLSPDVPAGTWAVQVRAADVSGLTDTTPATVRFTRLAGNNLAPETAITAPAAAAPGPPGAIVTGTATDDAGVAAVEVALRDGTTGRYWNATTASWQTALVRNRATVATPGATSTRWSVVLPGTDGANAKLTVSARAVDGAGLPDPTSATRVLSGLSSGAGFAGWDVWQGITGQSLASIPTGTAATTSETADLRATGLSLDTSLENVGGRVRVLLRPTVSGSYVFWLSSDDNGSLRLNPAGADPAGAKQIASVASHTSLNTFTTYASQKSAAVTLTAGREYYLEAVFKEQTGSDHVQVAWSPPGTSTPVIVPASAFAAPGTAGLNGWH